MRLEGVERIKSVCGGALITVILLVLSLRISRLLSSSYHSNPFHFLSARILMKTRYPIPNTAKMKPNPRLHEKSTQRKPAKNRGETACKHAPEIPVRVSVTQ